MFKIKNLLCIFHSSKQNIYNYTVYLCKIQVNFSIQVYLDLRSFRQKLRMRKVIIVKPKGLKLFVNNSAQSSICKSCKSELEKLESETVYDENEFHIHSISSHTAVIIDQIIGGATRGPHKKGCYLIKFWDWATSSINGPWN